MSQAWFGVLMVGALLSSACGGDGPARDDAHDGDTADDTASDTSADTAPGDTGADDDTRAPDPPLARLDWRDARGAPLATVEATLGAQDLVAVHAGGAVVGGGCAEEHGCDYAWLDAAGAPVRARDSRFLGHGGVVSPDGSLLALVAGTRSLCQVDDGAAVVLDGRLELVAVASGEALVDEPARTLVFFGSAFSPEGAWLHDARLAPGSCDALTDRWRATTAPYAPMARASATLSYAQELADGRWIAFDGETLVVVDPRDAAVPAVRLGDRVDGWRVGGGWVHAYDGYGSALEVDRVLAPDGARYDLTLPEGDLWAGRTASGRWLLACSSRHVGDLASCALFDVLAEVATRELALAPESGREVAFLGGAAVALFLTHGDDGALALVRLDPATGAREVLASGPGRLRVLGDDEAALWVTDGAVQLIEPGGVTPLVEGAIAQVVTLSGGPNGAPPSRGSAREPRQRWTALVVETLGVDASRLWAFDLATRRLAQLTDRLAFAPSRDAPLFADRCAQPWVTRSAGGPGDGLLQSAGYLYFAERDDADGAQAPLWLAPIDLSGPPRLLARGAVAACRAPYASPGGARAAALYEVDAASRRLVLGAR